MNHKFEFEWLLTHKTESLLSCGLYSKLNCQVIIHVHLSSHRGGGAGPADTATAELRYRRRAFACRQEAYILSVEIHAHTNVTVGT